jgi:hypothetical protein
MRTFELPPNFAKLPKNEKIKAEEILYKRQRVWDSQFNPGVKTGLEDYLPPPTKKKKLPADVTITEHGRTWYKPEDILHTKKERDKK